MKKGTILYFSKDGSLIVHRIVSITQQEDGKYEFKTKGDNNNTNDNWVVTEKEVIGVGKFMVPYIGYPSVLVISISAFRLFKPSYTRISLIHDNGGGNILC